jgi:hypothetical protein
VLVGPMMKTNRTVVIGCVISVAVALIAVWVLGVVFLSPFRMHEDVVQQLVSPDGKYTAMLSYRDGLTFGYYHVTLERPALWGFRRRDEVTEVASEGLDGIAWRGPRTLVIHFSCPENEFVLQAHQWHGVRIAYKR